MFNSRPAIVQKLTVSCLFYTASEVHVVLQFFIQLWVLNLKVGLVCFFVVPAKELIIE